MATKGVTEIEYIPSENSYEVELGHLDAQREKGNASIKIGGDDITKFLPIYKAGKWSDEAWIEAEFESGDEVEIEVEDFEDGEVKIKIKGIEHVFRKKNDRDLKHDIIFDEEPESNIFTFRLRHSANLRFDHQGDLDEEWDFQSQGGTVPVFGKTTKEDFAKIWNRPDNIINSYAFRIVGKKNNKYLTGKFCHIERVQFKDATNNTIWATQVITPISLTESLWTITVDQAWLSDANYPVTMDPVLGYNTIGGSNIEPGEVFFGGQFDAPANTGTIDDIQIYAEKTGGSPEIIMGMYEDVSGDIEGSDLLSANSVAKTLPAAPAWVQDTAITGNIVASTTYWLATETEAGWAVYYDTGTAGYNTAKYYSGTYDGVLPDPAPTGMSDYTAELSFYINYTEASVGETYIRNVLSSLDLNDSNKKLMTFKRLILETVDLTELLKRLIDRKRLFLENVDLNDSNKKAMTFKRMIQSTVNLFDSIKNKLSTKLTEIIQETIDLVESIKNPFVFKRPVYALVNLNGSNKRSIDFKRLLFSTVDFIDSNKRAFSFTRSLYGNESINDSNKRIKGLKKFIYDAIDIIASVKDQLVAGGEAFIRIFLESIDLVDLSKKQVTYKRFVLSLVNLAASIKRSIVYKRLVYDTVDLISIIKRVITFKRQLYGKENLYDSNKKKSVFKRLVFSIISITASLKSAVASSIKKIVSESVIISESVKETISTVIKKILLDTVNLFDNSFKKLILLRRLYALFNISDSSKRLFTFKRIILTTVSLISISFKKITYKRLLKSTVNLFEVVFRKRTLVRLFYDTLSIIDSVKNTLTLLPVGEVFYKIYQFLYETIFHRFKIDRSIKQFKKDDSTTKIKKG